MQFGKALLASVDQASNLYAIGEHFENAKKIGTGTVNLGSVLLFLFGAIGATIITLFIWKRGPFKVLATGQSTTPLAITSDKLSHDSRPPKDEKVIQVGMIPRVDGFGPMASIPLVHPLDVAKNSGVLLKSSTSQFDLNGIGIIRGVWVEFLRQPTDHWACTCAVDFHALGTAVEASPLQLILTGNEGKPELATLTAEYLPIGAGFVVYKGTAHSSEMPICIEQAMGGTTEARTLPPAQNTYCYVEVRVAPASRIAHQKTTVRLEHELIGHPHRHFFVPIIYKPLKTAALAYVDFMQRIQNAFK